MSDQHESAPQPELTPEQEAAVRRLLAEARHDEPLPADIGDRLDRVLAGLSHDTPDRSSRVVDLAARRRRNAGRLLIAAAAVIVGGFAVGQVIDVGGTADDSAGSDSAGAGRENLADDQAADGVPSPEAEGPLESTEPGAASKAEPLQLTSQNLQREVQRQLKRSTSANLAADGATYDGDFGCAPAAPETYGSGRLYLAYFDGLPTVLALRPPAGESQEAQVLECGTGIPLRSVIVRAP